MQLLVSPEHARLALQADKSTAYAIYCILRSAIKANKGSSHYTKSELKNQLETLNISPRKWTRILESGNGIFWNMEYKRLYLRSYHHVTKRLERVTGNRIDYNKRFCVEIALEIDARDTSATIASKLYFSWFLARGEVTIARATISDLFGISADRQRHYESLLEGLILVKHNYAHIDSKKYAKNPRQLPEHHYTFGYERFADDKVSEHEAIQYQLPNTFIVSSGNGRMTTTTGASKSLVKAIRSKQWHTESYCCKDAAYSHTWHDFEHSRSNPQYVRAYYQGIKRLWLSSHYL